MEHVYKQLISLFFLVVFGFFWGGIGTEKSWFCGDQHGDHRVGRGVMKKRHQRKKERNMMMMDDKKIMSRK